MQMFGDLDTLSFIRIIQLNLIGQVNRMNNKKQVKFLKQYSTGKSTKRTKKCQMVELCINRYWLNKLNQLDVTL